VPPRSTPAPPESHVPDEPPDWDEAAAEAGIWDFLHRPMYYDPDGHPIDLHTWGDLMQQRTENLKDGIPRESWWGKKTMIGDVEISTVWLGLDHSFLTGPPLTWETMIFGGRYADADLQWRYTTRGQAYDHHEQIIRNLRAGKEPDD
jgi:hypothetical protein